MNNRVKAIRKAQPKKQATLEKFGEPLGLKKSALSLIESGKNALTEQNIKAICRVYNVSEDWLRTGEGEMFIQKSKDEEIATFIGRIQMEDKINFKKRFISALAKLDESEWEVLEKLVVEMCKEKD